MLEIRPKEFRIPTITHTIGQIAARQEKKSSRTYLESTIQNEKLVNGQ
jgi:hypothetical protein